MDGFSGVHYSRNDFKSTSENFFNSERNHTDWSLKGEKRKKAETEEFIDLEKNRKYSHDVSKRNSSPRDISAMAYTSYGSTSSYSNAASQSRSSKDSSILENPFYHLYPEYAAAGYACECMKCTSYRSKCSKIPRPVSCYVNAYNPSVSNSRVTSPNNTFPFSYTSPLLNDNCTVTQTTGTASTNDSKSDIGFDFTGNESNEDKLLCKEDDVDEIMTDKMQASDDGETVFPDSERHSNEASSPRVKNEIIGFSLDALIDGSNSEFQEIMKKKEKNTFLTETSTNMKSVDSYDEANGEIKSNLILSSENASKRKKEGHSTNTEKSSTDIPRPPFSYVALIRMAIKASPGKRATLQDIYRYIRQNFEYYRLRGSGWQNSIRHNLTINKCFDRIDNENGRRKGGYWMFNPNHEHEFQNGDWRRRVRMKKPNGKKPVETQYRTVSPIITQTYHSPLPYSHHFWNYSADLFAHSYRSINSGERNWFSSHVPDTFCHANQSTLSTHPSCQSLQTTCQTLHMGLVPSNCVDATTTKSSETPFTLSSPYAPSPYTADSYVSPGSAFPSSQYLRDTTQQTSHHQRAY